MMVYEVISTVKLITHVCIFIGLVQLISTVSMLVVQSSRVELYCCHWFVILVPTIESYGNEANCTHVLLQNFTPTLVTMVINQG